MHVEDAPAYPRLAEIGNVAPDAECFVVEARREFAVFLPPCPQRVHVVRRSGADREIGVVRRVGEEFPRRLGHALDFEREDLQFVHRFGDAVGDHPQVFAAGQHLGRREEYRELAQGGFLPETVVPVVEEVGIEPVEGRAALSVEPAVGMCRVGGDARVEIALAARVFDEEHVVEQCHKPFPQPGLVFVVAREAGCDLALGGIGGQ